MPNQPDKPKTPHLSFDFNKAVVSALHDFPQATKDVTFIDLDAPDARAQIAAWVQDLEPDDRARLTVNGELAEMTPESAGFALRIPGSRHGILAIHSKFQENVDILHAAPEKQAGFLFRHELGHLVVPGASGLRTAFAENAADLFSAGMGLRDGSLTAEDVQNVRLDRLRQYLGYGDVLHLAAAALGRLVEVSQDAKFHTLEPKDIVLLAQKHGDNLSLGPEAQQRFDQALDAPEAMDPKRASQQILLQLSRLMLQAPRNSAGFQTPAQILRLYAKSGILDNAPTGPQDPPHHWALVKQAIGLDPTPRAATPAPAR
jgi:hypothetical protein